LSSAGTLRFLILRDHRENRKKCTLTPLEGREGFTFVRLGPEESFLLDSGLILDVEGAPLRAEDRELVREAPIVVVDGSWARAGKVLARLRMRSGALLERRSIPGIVTAYPRRSKLFQDPPAGLASIEAIYAVSAILLEPRPDLLRDYHWAAEFLARNWGK
jgi:pre-rRNA-processing protein TSR3